MWEFPSPTMTATQMYTYFDEHFDFSPNEVVALMGAHTLGGARRQNSGYIGLWIAGGQDVFDNRYYSIMTDNAITWVNQVS